MGRGSDVDETRISIVTPSFNQARFVEETLQSVLTQNYPNLEYIVVDGASTDGSPAIIERHRQNLAYYVSEPDSGHGEALNKGFARSTGEIMGWLNSDDLYCPWTLRTVAEIFDANPDIEWLCALQGFWNDRGVLTRVTPQSKNVLDYLDGDYRWIQQETVFWRRSLWERAGGRINEDYRLMVDGELWTRFFGEAELWHAQCVLGGYRQHNANRATVLNTSVHSEMKQAIEAMRARLTPERLASLPTNYPWLTYNAATSGWDRIRVPRRRD